MPTRSVRIHNVTRGTVLGTAEVAGSPWARLRGLMGRTGLAEGEGLLIRPCNSIHMFFMRFAIDVLYCGASTPKGDPVLRVAHAVKPWRIGPIVWKGKYVIELPAGTAERHDTRAGDLLRLEELPAGPL